MTGIPRKSRFWLSILAAVALLAAASAPARAETQHIPMGLSDFMGGVLPPPGFYWLNYLLYVQKDRLLDNDGDERRAAPGGPKLDFEANALVDAFRFVWMSPAKMLGANYGAQVILPVYSTNAELKVAGAEVFDSDSKGLGDIVVAPVILAWHFSPNFHMGAALDIAIPTGPYDKDEPATQILNKNHWTFEPLVAISYWVPGGFDASAKIMYDFHTKNGDPSPPAADEQKPGQEFHFDWGLSHALGKEDLRLGLAGFYYMETTETEIDGVKQDKSRQAAIGPAFKWWPGMKKFSVTAKYLREFAGKNVADGQSFWINTVYAF